MSAWEYCVVDLDSAAPGAYLLTPFGPRQILGELSEAAPGADFDPLGEVAGAPDAGHQPANASSIIARLGDEGWELAGATTEVVGDSGIGIRPGLRTLRSNRLLYFKRPK